MEQNLFRVGGVYRSQGGGVVRLDAGGPGAICWDVERHGHEHAQATSLSGWSIFVADDSCGYISLKDGRYCGSPSPLNIQHLVPGELHQVDGQWVAVDLQARVDRFCDFVLGAVLVDEAETHHAKMLRKDAEGFAAAKPFVAPAIPQKLVQGPHAPISGLTRVGGFSHLLGAGVR